MGDKNAEALQQYLLLAKNAKGKAAVALITQALNAPGLYHFGELLSHPNIAPLEQSDKSSFDALRIFAFGTLTDYKAQAGLPELSPQQLTKLRQLSLVSLAHENKVIPYSLLLERLNMANVRELEDLIIDSFYSGLIKGKLDQKSKQLEVDFAVSRDVRPGQVEVMMKVLNDWIVTSDNLVKAIDEQLKYAVSAQETQRLHKKEYDAKLETMKANVKAMAESDMIPDFGPDYDDDPRGKGKKGMMKGMKGGPMSAAGQRKNPKRFPFF